MAEHDTKHPVEAYTTVYDYLKHLTSLSTGSILLIVALLEKLFSRPLWKGCIAVSLISFFFTVVACLIAQVGVMEQISDRKEVARWAEPLSAFSILVAWLAFLAGLLSLLIFALKNLYA